jgi:hypothetical protein
MNASLERIAVALEKRANSTAGSTSCLRPAFVA